MNIEPFTRDRGREDAASALLESEHYVLVVASTDEDGDTQYYIYSDSALARTRLLRAGTLFDDSSLLPDDE